MRKFLSYLKPFSLFIAIAVALLFVQAISDLKLPDYMSNIVNIGIQQGGIENAAPEYISASGMQFMTTFMKEEDKAFFQNAYEWKSSQEAGLSNYNDNVYALKKVTKEEQLRLNTLFGESSWTMINFFQENQAGGEQTSAMSMEDVDIRKMYALLPTLEGLPSNAFDNARAKAQNVAEATKLQTGTMFTKAMYQELNVDLTQLQFMYILKTGGMMLLITIIGALSAIAVGFLASNIGANVARRMRKDVFEKVESFSNAEFDKYSTSSLITRTTNDITQVMMFVIMGIRLMFYAPILGIGGVIMIVQKNSSMTWILGVTITLLIGLVLFILLVAMPKFKMIQKLIDNINLVARENLSGLMVVRAFGTQEFEEQRFDEANQRLTKTSLVVNRVMVFMMPAMMLIMNFTTLLIVWVGSGQIADSVLQVGDMMAFMQYAMQIIMAFLMLSMIFILVPRSTVSLKRIFEVLDTKPSICDKEETVSFIEEKKGYVEFEHVSFRYHGADEDVIHDINFVAKPGETTAFIGSTGAGKSTLINLIPRFYDVTSGSVRVNGVDVRDVSQHDLHEQIGYVPQKASLLSGTIESNLRYGKKEATQEEIEKAASIAQASEFIAKKEDGYESVIAQGGSNVSGGQKQRLSIARALAIQAPIYIFDDSFSALDFKTDSTLRKALKENIQDATVMIVAQRVSSIMHAEQIIVLDEGKVVGIGRHEDLLKSCPTYYEIAASQLTKEELENVDE